MSILRGKHHVPELAVMADIEFDLVERKVGVAETLVGVDFGCWRVIGQGEEGLVHGVDGELGDGEGFVLRHARDMRGNHVHEPVSATFFGEVFGAVSQEHTGEVTMPGFGAGELTEGLFDFGFGFHFRGSV